LSFPVPYKTGQSSGAVKLEDSVQYLKGVGPQRAKALSEAGIRTVEDLLYHVRTCFTTFHDAILIEAELPR